MITRKISYVGTFTPDAVNAIYDVVRNNEITGQVRVVSEREVELNLEGDPSFIKLIQHQIERKVKTAISGKTVTQLAYQNYQGIILLKN